MARRSDSVLEVEGWGKATVASAGPGEMAEVGGEDRLGTMTWMKILEEVPWYCDTEKS